MARRLLPDPTREGVTIDPFGEITVPEKKRSWTEDYYRARYDNDPISVWVIDPRGNRALFRMSGPASARAWIHGFRPGTLHYAHWGLPPEGKLVFPQELVEYAARVAQPDGGR